MRAQHHAVLTAMLRRAQWQEALQVLGQMSEDQIRPNVVSYNCASSACAKKSRWQQSWQLLREMETKKVWPDAKSFGACASAAEKSHRWTLALQLLRTGQCSTHSEQVTQGGNIPYLFSISCNAQVLHPIATSFAPWSPPWARRSAGALRWPRWRPNWARMSTLSSAQQWQQALEQLLRPEAASPRVVPAPLVTSFLRGMGLASQWLLALVIFHQLRVPLRTRPDTPTMNAAMGCAAAGQAWKVALAILKESLGLSFARLEAHMS
eukprot:g13736.t2